MKEEKSNLDNSNIIKPKKDDIIPNVNLDTTKAMESVEKLKSSLDSIKPLSLGDFAEVERPPQIIYNYYNCSFSYGDHGYASNESKRSVKNDSDTTPMDFCSHAEKKDSSNLKDAVQEISHMATYGITYCLDTVPVHTQILVKILESFNREHKLWIDIRRNPPARYEEVILAAKHRNGTWDIRIDKFCGFTPDNRALSGTYTENWDIKYWMPKPREPEEN